MVVLILKRIHLCSFDFSLFFNFDKTMINFSPLQLFVAREASVSYISLTQEMYQLDISL